MHASSNDDFCFIHSGVHARKMHTSRRDAFKSIDVSPVAKVTRSGHVEILDYQPKEEPFRPIIEFDKRVALIKVHPGFRPDQLKFYLQNGYRGVVLEGTGLGHLPINETDEYTKDHPALLETVKMAAKNMIVVMTSQCIFGKVNLNVYSPGRKLLEAGVIPARMTPETAFVKLGWVLGQRKGMEESKQLFEENFVGEIVDRIDPEAFLD
jgi:glutamyl-tRNA(Gln) amidotransferase subunit D